MNVDPGTVFGGLALIVTAVSVYIGHRHHDEDHSLDIMHESIAALESRVRRTEEELEVTRVQLDECQRREARLDQRDQDRLRRILRLEDVLIAAGVPLPPNP